MNKVLLVGTISVVLLVGSFSGAWASATITGFDIVDGSIKSIDIGDRTVANVDLATDAVDGSKIKNLSISNSDLGDGIVTSGKIKDGTIQRQDIASGVMPAGATNVIYGTCHINIISEANGFAFGSCPVPGVVIGDAVVGNVAGLGDAGEFDVKLESLTTQTGDCDPCENGLIHWIVKNDGSEPINITTVLQYIVFNNNINVDG